MGGLDGQHTGHIRYYEPVEDDDDDVPTHTAGSLKWSYSLGGGVKAITGIALATEDGAGFPEHYEYRIFFGADNHKICCRQVDYNTSTKTFSVTTVGGWTDYEIDDADDLANDPPDLSDATGTPVLSIISSVGLVFITSTGGRVHCISQSSGALVWRSTDSVAWSYSRRRASGRSRRPDLHLRGVKGWRYEATKGS